MLRVSSIERRFGLPHIINFSFVPIDNLSPFALGVSRDRLIGIVDGMAMPLGVTPVVIFRMPEYPVSA
jgi:hypothetical protein